MSGIKISEENFYIEHNEELDSKEIEEISALVNFFNIMTEHFQKKTENS